jgi:DNA processing protein
LSEIEDRVLWVALAGADGVGPVAFRSLLARFGSPAAVFSASDDELLSSPRVGPVTLASIRESAGRIDRIEEMLVALRDSGIRPIILSDGEYPARLAEIPNPPPLLWARGKPLSGIESPVAVVGSRLARESGLAFAWSLGRELAARGCTIVSGLAQGIDAAAHSGALYMRHRTCAGVVTLGVLGTGIDVLFPKATIPVAAGVVRHGALICEVRPGTGPQPGNFMARDRIISGLSQITVIGEAKTGSGTMDTFGHALRQRRMVAAVDWGSESDETAGNREAISRGAIPISADPVRAASEIESSLS